MDYIDEINLEMKMRKFVNNKVAELEERQFRNVEKLDKLSYSIDYIKDRIG